MPAAKSALLPLLLMLALPAGAALSAVDPALVWSVPPQESPHGAAAAAAAALLPGEVRVTSTPQWQNEPALAVNPLDPANIIAGANDYHYHGAGGFVWVGEYTSHDGGATWSERPLPGTGGLAGAAGGVLPFASAGDPIMAFDGLGTAYAGGIDFAGGQSWIFVSASADGGETWLQPTLPSGVVGMYGFQDKPDMAGDPAAPLVHVCWTDFGLGAIAASTGVAGSGWTPLLPISEIGPVQGCSIAVGPDGAVYVAYLRYNGGLASGGTLKLVKAAPGGVGWSMPAAIATAQPVSGANFRINSFPSLAVDASGTASDGDLYVAWTDNRAGNADVWLVKSTDAGASWTSPARVNAPNTAGEFEAAVAVGPTGKVYVTYYTTRFGGYTYFGATSTDGGATFTEQALASAPTPASATGGFLGDYTDVQVGGDGVAHAVWADGRTGDQDLWVRSFS